MPEGYSKTVSVDEYKRGAYGPDTQHIIRSNLEIALSEAIRALEKEGRGNIILVEGWREVLQASKDGKRITVIEGDS